MADSKHTSVSVNLGGIGSILAAVFSYTKWHSFWLAFGHFLLGWIYVFYYLIVYGNPFVR